MSTIELTCIRCPVGCRLKIDRSGEELSVSGNNCEKGPEFAREEILDPRRTLTTSVRVLGGVTELVSVKTDKPLRKNDLMKAMETIRELSVRAPISQGQVIYRGLLGTEINLVSTRSVEEGKTP